MARRSKLADNLVEAIGYAATRRLVREYGGKRVRIPTGTGTGGTFGAWLDEALGIEAARALKANFGGEAIDVPMLYEHVLAERNRLIVADYDSNMSMLEIVRKYELTERQIRTILKQVPSDDTFGSRVLDDKQMALF